MRTQRVNVMPGVPRGIRGTGWRVFDHASVAAHRVNLVAPQYDMAAVMWRGGAR